MLSLIVASTFIVATMVNASLDLNDPGAWLAKELGMDSVRGATGALDSLKNPAPSAAQSANIAASKVSVGNPEAEKEISELMTEVQTNKSPDVASKLAGDVTNKINALRSSGRYMEALIENQRLKQVCLNYGGCPPTLATDMANILEQEMAKGGDRAILGVGPNGSSADIKKARKNLSLLLHPDKNTNLDASGKAYLKDLFVKMQGAYDKLSN